MLKKLKRISIFVFVLTYLVFEELVWNKIALPIHTYVKSLRLYEKFLIYTQEKANRYLVLCFFILPFVIAELLGIIAGLLLAKLYILPAIFIYMLKIPLAIAAFGVLKAGKEKLDSFKIFYFSYIFIERLIDRLHESRIYASVKSLLLSIKEVVAIARSRLVKKLRLIYESHKEQQKK